MSLSVGNLAVGLAVGVVLGFVATQVLQRDTSQQPNQNPHVSASNKVDVKLPATESKPTAAAITSAVVVDKAVPEAASQSLSDVEFNAADLRNYRPYSNGFSAELALMNNLASADFDQLEALADELLADQSHFSYSPMSAMSMIGLRMVELDKDRTMEFVQNSMSAANVLHGPHGMTDIISALALSHHEQLLQWSEGLNNGSGKQEIQRIVLTGLAGHDPLAAIAIYEQNDQPDHNGNLYSIVSAWTETDPQAAMQWAMNRSPSVNEMDTREMIFSQWISSDPDSANAFLQSVDDEELRTQFEMYASTELANRQPREALDRIMSIDDPESRSMVIESAMYSWSATSFDDAVDYATNSLSGADQELAYRVLSDSVSMHGPDQFGQSALEIMQTSYSLPEGMGTRLRQSNMQPFFSQDPDGAMQWLDSVSDTEERTRLLESIAWEIPRYDLGLAQTLFEQSDSRTRSMLAPGIAEKLYEDDPASAWVWYDQLADEMTKQEVFYSLVQMESHNNPEEAMRLASNAPGPYTAELVFSVFASAAYEHPDWARQWLDQADVDPQQMQMMRQILDDSRFNERDYYESQYMRGY